MAQQSPHLSSSSSLTDLDVEMQSPQSPEQVQPHMTSDSSLPTPCHAPEQESTMNFVSHETIPDSEAEESDEDADNHAITSYHSEHNNNDGEHDPTPKAASMPEMKANTASNTTHQATTVNLYMTRKQAGMITHEYLDHLEHLHIRNDKHVAFWNLFNGFAKNQRWARLMKSIPGNVYQRDEYSNLSGTFTNYEVCRLLAQGFHKNHARKIWEGNAVSGRVWQQAGSSLHHRQDKEVYVQNIASGRVSILICSIGS